MRGKICVVTGTTSGIGYETALALAARGATVVTVNRDGSRAAAAASRIRAETGSDEVHCLVADLSRQDDVRRVAGEILERWDRIHVLVNNAGGIFGERRQTEDGREYTWALDHLAYFLLTDLLRERLVESAPARVISVASEAQRSGHIDFEDPEGSQSYSGMRAYTQAKLANVVFSVELAERLEGTGVTANAMHPGAVATRFANEGPWWMRLMVKLIRPFMRSPAKGAETVIWLATDPLVIGESGKYWADKAPARPNPEALDPKVRRRLWDLSSEQVSA